jgi:hypothetical protein
MVNNLVLRSQIKALAMAAQVKRNLVKVYNSEKEVLKSESGEGYIDTAVKILIAVVLGAVVLAGLYAILKNTVMPSIDQKIKDMFNYSGN